MPRKIVKPTQMPQRCTHIANEVSRFSVDEETNSVIYYAKCSKCRKPFKATASQAEAVASFEEEAIATLLPDAKIYSN